MVREKTLIVLDSKKYAPRSAELRDRLAGACDPDFYFTDYENGFIKFLHGVPGVGDAVSHLSYWAISLAAACRIRFAMRGRYSAKIFINPIVGAFYCFLLAASGSKDNVTVAGFLFVGKKSRLYLALRERFVNFAYRPASRIIVYSRREVEFYSQRFPSLSSRFTFVRYGRDYDIFEEKEYKSDDRYIASGGISNRDFGTLASAFGVVEKALPGLKCKIATRPGVQGGGFDSGDVDVLNDIRIETFGSFLQKALVVVIPLKDVPLSAGHMVLLEAMYRGKAIVVADVPGMRDYVGEDTVFFYKAGDIASLASTLGHVLGRRLDPEVQEKAGKAQRLYSSDYGFGAFLSRVVAESV